MMRTRLFLFTFSTFFILFCIPILSQKIKETPAPEDIPQPVKGDIGLAGAKCPDIARYLNVRTATAPSLSPDGTRLAYRTETTGQPQVWVTETQSKSAPKQVTFGESVTFHDWSPVGDWIAYGTDRSGNEREGFYLISPDGTRERELLSPSESFRIWGGWSRDGTRIAYAATEAGSDDFNIYTIDLQAKTANPRRVYEGNGGIYVASWRPDGSGMLLTKARGEDANDILYLNLKTGKAETLFAPKEAASYDSFAWTPDGRGFYLSTNEDRNFAGLAFFDMGTRKLRWIETPERDVEIVVLSADGRYLAWTENANGFSELKVRDLSTKRLLRMEGLPRGVIGSLEWAAKAPRLIIGLSSPQVPGDIWLFDASIARLSRTTESTLAGLDVQKFVAPEAVSLPSHDGETIYGLLYLPQGVSARNRPSVVLNVHGGPTSQARPGFNAVHQYLIARGYAVLDLNFRGSTGFGKRFTRLDNGRLRPNAVKDMGAALDWLAQSRYPVNASRAAVVGRSYGGYMALAALTQLPDKFDAGVNFVGVSNWVTALEGASPQLKASDRIEYGNIDDPADREFFRQLSPLTHVANIRAPLMVLHGANDPRDPVAEADQIVRAIRERGGDVEYLRFPDEGHSITKLSNRIIAFRRVLAFLERSLGKGVVDCDK